ncbi:nucleoporin NUP2, partial [Phenoliferia sp. Uapishka_3]
PTAPSPSASPFGAFSFGAGSAPPAAAIAPEFAFPTTKTATVSEPANTFPGAPAFSFPTVKTHSTTGPPLLTYYMSVRALNLAVVDALRAKLDKDPFLNLAGPLGAVSAVMERYEAHWKTITSTRDAGKDHKTAIANGKASEPFRPTSPVPTISIEEAPEVTMSEASTSVPTPVSTSSAPPPPVVSIPFDWAAARAGADDPPPPPPAPKAKEPAFSLPAPPTSFKWGGKDVTPSEPGTSKPPVLGGFVLKPIEADPYAEKSAFKFGSGVSVPAAPLKEDAPTSSKPSPVSSTTASEAPKADTKKLDAPKKFSFGESFGGIAKGSSTADPKTAESATSETAKVPEAVTNPFAFGASGPSTTSTAPAKAPGAFAFGSSTSSSSAPTPAFGSASSSDKVNPFSSTGGFNNGSTTAFTPTQPKPIPKPMGSPPITTSFGFGAAGSPPTFGFGAALGSKAPPPVAAVPGFSFGGATSGGFGSMSSSSTAQPAKMTTGFSFGAAATPSTFPGATSSVAAFPAAKVTTGFAFGSAPTPPAAPITAPVSATTSTSGGTADEGAVAPEDGNLPVVSSGLLGKGVGEEGEKVLYELRAKVFRIKGSDATDLGVASVYIKEREDDGSKRVLARNQGNGAVVMNFRLQPGMTVKVEKTFLTFMGFDGTTPQTYRLRVKTVGETEEAKKMLEEHAGAK